MSDKIPVRENDGRLVAVIAQVAVIAVLVIAAVIIVARFEMFCLRDLTQTADSDLQYLTRQGWIVLIVVAIPLGGIVYLYREKIR
jgi:uncharacterized membrane protein YjgN (DUF898 family)